MNKSGVGKQGRREGVENTGEKERGGDREEKRINEGKEKKK